MTNFALLDAVAGPAQDQASAALRDLWLRYGRTGDTSAEETLVEEYLPLVRAVVGSLARSWPAHLTAKDLYGAGMVGLLQAIRNFDANRGASFKTFACFRIRGAVLDEVRCMDWVSRRVHEKARLVRIALAELEQRLGAPPSEQQMADALGITLDGYGRWLDEIRAVTFVYLDAAVYGGAGDEIRICENIPDDSQENPFDGASRSDLNALIAERIRQLAPMQQKVLSLYYHKDLGMREIAKVVGLTTARISQIHSKAILAIRSFIEWHETIAPAGAAKRAS
jgi:RNA polymerase sigma factor FliA